MKLASLVMPAALALIALSMLLHAGCTMGDRAPNIILVTLDTVRSDHLSCYGYERNTSPNLDAFSESATLHSRAIASSPWTVPTHASLFTGKFSFEHGAHTFEVDEQVDNNVNPLSMRFQTIAEALSEQGYETAAFVANAAFLGPHWQLNQGFETYNVEHVWADTINRKVFQWLSSRQKDKPFFLFVNYMDAHGPFNTSSPAPFITNPIAADKGNVIDALYQAVMPGTDPVPQDVAGQVVDMYDTGIWNLDREIGALLNRIKELGFYDDSVIVFVSDHGEYFGEHHLVTHAKDVYEEVLRVPMISKMPGQTSAARSDAVVTSTDIAGLMLSSLPASMKESLLGQFTDTPGNHEVITENYYTRPHDLFNDTWGHRFDRVRTAIYEGPLKLIYSSDNRHELYDLDADPTESTNLYTERKELAQRLEAKLLYFQSTRRRSDELVDQDPLTEEQLEKLRSLGYIGN
jgi:arylsulfatase A-like enzyme